AQEFLDRNLDVLVGLYQGRHDVLERLVAGSQAKFKVGFSGADDRLCDLLLAIDPREVTAVKAELKKYLGILGKL
ncbi:MAG: hypothetical protein R3359_11300, partial [Marinirhabdus sp.]|nr:hypothetical protein [Marinirhabdus sp.]